METFNESNLPLLLVMNSIMARVHKECTLAFTHRDCLCSDSETPKLHARRQRGTRTFRDVEQKRKECRRLIIQS
jgi:hypothetical protein